MPEVPDDEVVAAEHYEEAPTGGWKGADLTEDEIADDDYSKQFRIAQVKGEPNGVG